MRLSRIVALPLSFLVGQVAHALDSPPAPVVAYVGATLIRGAAPGAEPSTVVVTRGGRIAAVRFAVGFKAEPGEDAVVSTASSFWPGSSTRTFTSPPSPSLLSHARTCGVGFTAA